MTDCQFHSSIWITGFERLIVLSFDSAQDDIVND